MKKDTKNLTFLDVYMMFKALSTQDIMNIIKLMQKQTTTVKENVNRGE